MNVFSQKVCTFIRSKNAVYAGLIAVLQVILSFFTDKFIFSQDARCGLKYLFFKGLLFFVLFIALYFIIDFFKKLLVEKNRNLMIYLKVFLFFFICYSIVLALIYPGNWMYDDIGILVNAANNLSLYALQHILTSVFYILALMIFPMPVSVIILQYAIISAIIAYFIGKLYNYGGRKYLWSAVLFLLPPVLIHTLYPLRLCIFAFLELLFFFIINEKKEVAGCETLMLIIGLNSILAAWRSECIFFMLFIPIYFIYKKYPVKTTIFATVIIVTIPAVLTAMNNYCAGKEDEIGYKVTGIVRPFHALMLEDIDKNEGKIIEEITDIVDVETAVSYEDGETAFWDYVYKDVDAKDDFKKMTEMLLKLIKKYPNALIKERWEVFHTSQNVLDKNGDIRNVVAKGNIYFKNSPSSFSNQDIELTPLNIDLRAKTLLFLYSKGNNSIISNIIRWTYNLLLPIILLIFLLAYSIIKKDIELLLSALFLLAQAAAVFVTAPAPLFMYYFPIYICGYGLFIANMRNIFGKE